jgi:uncharacterized damage-inducible protein DinB
VWLDGFVFTRGGITAFHTWTHASLGVLLDHVAELPKEAYTRELEGFGITSIRGQVVHILEGEVRWIHRAQGLAFDGLKPEAYPSLASARAL